MSVANTSMIILIIENQQFEQIGSRRDLKVVVTLTPPHSNLIK